MSLPLPPLSSAVSRNCESQGREGMKACECDDENEEMKEGSGCGGGMEWEMPGIGWEPTAESRRRQKKKKKSVKKTRAGGRSTYMNPLVFFLLFFFAGASSCFVFCLFLVFFFFFLFLFFHLNLVRAPAGMWLMIPIYGDLSFCFFSSPFGGDPVRMRNEKRKRKRKEMSGPMR